MTVTIYHNPNCGTSRNVLAMIRQSGEEPVIIEYLKNPPTRERLKELIAAMGIPVRTLVREKGTPYAELGLADPKWTDDQLLDFMMAHPILINRPIVVTPKGVWLCRPSEKVIDIRRIRILAASSKRTERLLRSIRLAGERARAVWRISLIFVPPRIARPGLARPAIL
jgi:arsenate reductase (glutaredoxin)